MKKQGLTRREFIKYGGTTIGVLSASGFFPGLNIFAAEPKTGGQPANFLAVPGARLYYEICGSGPLLIMITGANGDAGV